MKLSKIFSAFFLILSSSLPAAVQVPPSSFADIGQVQNEDEIAAMNSLVENTLHQLEMQKQMRQMMIDFQKQKQEFARGNQSKIHAALMVRTARHIYESILSHHLQHLFSQGYLDELLFFSSIAGKNKMKAPS